MKTQGKQSLYLKSKGMALMNKDMASPVRVDFDQAVDLDGEGKGGQSEEVTDGRSD